MEQVTQLSEVKPGMVLASDIRSNGSLLVRRGVVIDSSLISKLTNYNIKNIIIEKSEDEIAKIAQKKIDPLYIIQKETIKYAEDYIEKLISTENPQKMKTTIMNSLSTALENQELLKTLILLRTCNHYSHCLKVAIISTGIGINLGLSAKELIELMTAGLIYDIGKCFIDKNIIFKDVEFNSWEDKQAIKEHTIMGYMFLKDKFPESISRTAMEHHERFNGTGYPKGLTNQQVSPYSRIIATVDVYVALRSDRPYRRAYPPSEAIEYILGAGNILFDHEVVRAFTEIVSIYSTGSVVLLNNGVYGMVIDVDNSIGRPVIRELYDENFNELAGKEIDLSKNYTLFIKEVVEY